jgi:site-specific DNA-methyltransferase (adenine-specific)
MSKQPILTPFLDDIDVILYDGDCIEVMRQMPEDSVDAIVTDPPYGLEFMSKDWDAPWKAAGKVERANEDTDPSHPFRNGAPRVEYGIGGAASAGFQSFSEAWAREAFRILKPGGHLLAFAGTRTYHRMASGVEDAGFEIRDCIAWMYGSGFPKSLDVSKAIDKAAGAERVDVIGTRGLAKWNDGAPAGVALKDDGGMRQSWEKVNQITAPATSEAEAWNGWGTGLKPAFEPIVVARKPLIGTVAANVLEHGTGALNIDACRIAGDVQSVPQPVFGVSKGVTDFGAGVGRNGEMSSASGRWPANIALDETAANILDEQSGERPSQGGAAFDNGSTMHGNRVSQSDRKEIGFGDTGGASRFFYTAKASRQDRNAGGLADNTHPTVKPTELMRWLIRLVTPPGGIILDPFGGSGSTGLAARAENTRCILIEREPEYLQIIRDRLSQLNLFTENNQ